MSQQTSIQLVECPRDAMQGLHSFIPTPQKIELLKSLMQCGFHTLDCGSFVSAKSIPQLADSSEVISEVENETTNSELLVIVANERGAENALQHKNIDYLGFPFSISETFQQRNTNASRAEAFERLGKIQTLAAEHNKKVVAYLSMAFGNPYGDKFDNVEILDWVVRIKELGIQTISLADTVGSAQTKDIAYLFDKTISAHPEIRIGAHFHSTPQDWLKKIEPAYYHGCRRFDSALLGKGGCPMAGDDLTGNIATENLVLWLQQKGALDLDLDAFPKSVALAANVYGGLN